ncbi:aminodeoxychorismate lyase [Candidatus Nitrosoglobus terrae]|uniref:Endolytic murein transglycosylase n=1 Tax=Candidatus Nitrosoglobus terrae TaxID=1630141 RepID=A0A1Q2SMR3_9GAMM|nr:endolytic transglycosylase MltG [Candidatus Nitrosoglobus terrae]BAW80411.1 aminodeoxychorismate lyase [Candidatus Nitrosoglobus terrae]
MDRFFLSLLIISGFILGVWTKVKYDHLSYHLLHVNSKGSYFVIPKGATIHSVATDLYQKGFLDYPLYLELLARWRGVSRNIKAGEYYIQPEAAVSEFLQQIVSGKIAQHSLTLVEGWTFSQMMIAIRNSVHLNQTLKQVPLSEIMASLGYSQEHPEGRFFPDTYFFPTDTTDFEFLHRAYQLMKQHLIQEWEARAPDLPYRNPDEALILASIIERETALPKERPLVAGVFIRRLRKGMRLQADPTVIYSLGKDFNGNLRRQDLRTDTPYNTYTRLGLPPTPICMPSLESLHAALHPDKGEALYFVAQSDGSHYFSSTLEEHNVAVQAYQLGILSNQPRNLK